MSPTDLDGPELLLYVGLVRLLVNVDDIVSLQEMAWVRELTSDIGVERWRELAGRAKAEFGGLDGALLAADKLTRADARAYILEQLRALAASDEVVAEEEALIAGLERVWS